MKPFKIVYDQAIENNITCNVMIHNIKSKYSNMNLTYNVIQEIKYHIKFCLLMCDFNDFSFFCY